ncbi:hypothetical protein DFH06DRAFT_1324559 [Mycena polygramma]|nr:hypothetical protein DFH06DRAFT_1324559 [Mycena polygramma]
MHPFLAHQLHSRALSTPVSQSPLTYILLSSTLLTPNVPNPHPLALPGVSISNLNHEVLRCHRYLHPFLRHSVGRPDPLPSAGDVADHINMATGIANDLGKQVGALTSSSSPADIQGVAQNVATKLRSFSDGAKSYGAAAQGAPACGDADSQNVASASNQDLLNNLRLAPPPGTPVVARRRVVRVDRATL